MGGIKMYKVDVVQVDDNTYIIPTNERFNEYRYCNAYCTGQRKVYERVYFWVYGWMGKNKIN